MPNASSSLSAEHELSYIADRIRAGKAISRDERQAAADAIRYWATHQTRVRAGRARWNGVPDEIKREHMRRARLAAAQA